MSDTTTQLNPGSGGDLMDESLVTQADRVTQAKRPRVVQGFDDGTLAASTTNRAGEKVPVISLGDAVIHTLEAMSEKQDRIIELLEMLVDDVMKR